MIYTEHETDNQIFIVVYEFNDALFIVHCITIFPGIHLWYNTNDLVLESSQSFEICFIGRSPDVIILIHMIEKSQNHEYGIYQYGVYRYPDAKASGQNIHNTDDTHCSTQLYKKLFLRNHTEKKRF